MKTPTEEGKRRYPPTGYYFAPEGFFQTEFEGEVIGEPCTCDEHCAKPCRGESGDCECGACSLQSVVFHDAGQLYPKDPA
jgi:hypothetical protein